MSTAFDSVFILPEDWESIRQTADDLKLDGMRTLAVILGIERGHYTEQCDWHPDPVVWDYYQRMPDR